MAILNRLLIVLAGVLGLAVSGTAYAGAGSPRRGRWASRRRLRRSWSRSPHSTPM